METPYNPAARSSANFSWWDWIPAVESCALLDPWQLTHLWAYNLWQLKALSATMHFQKTKTTVFIVLSDCCGKSLSHCWFFFLNEANSVILIKLERGPARSKCGNCTLYTTEKGPRGRPYDEGISTCAKPFSNFKFATACKKFATTIKLTVQGTVHGRICTKQWIQQENWVSETLRIPSWETLPRTRSFAPENMSEMESSRIHN